MDTLSVSGRGSVLHAFASLVDGVPRRFQVQARRFGDELLQDGDLSAPVSARMNAGGDRVLCHRLVRQLSGRQLIGPGGNVTDRLSAATAQGGIRTRRTPKNPRDQDGDRHAARRGQVATQLDDVLASFLSLQQSTSSLFSYY